MLEQVNASVLLHLLLERCGDLEDVLHAGFVELLGRDHILTCKTDLLSIDRWKPVTKQGIVPARGLLLDMSNSWAVPVLAERTANR